LRVDLSVDLGFTKEVSFSSFCHTNLIWSWCHCMLKLNCYVFVHGAGSCAHAKPSAATVAAAAVGATGAGCRHRTPQPAPPIIDTALLTQIQALTTALLSRTALPTIGGAACTGVQSSSAQLITSVDHLQVRAFVETVPDFVLCSNHIVLF